MKKIFLVILITLFTACNATKRIAALKNDQGDLIGVVTKKDFQQIPYGEEWFNDFYTYYEVDQKVATEIKKHLKGVKIKGFMGTWCGDSQREIPSFYKLLEAAEFNFKKLKLTAVNRNKEVQGLEENINLLRVPTFIFYKNGKEIGRFVEHPNDDSTIEADILKIVSGQHYKHSYQK